MGLRRGCAACGGDQGPLSGMELGLPRSRQQPRPQHAPRARRGGPACPGPRPYLRSSLHSSHAPSIPPGPTRCARILQRLAGSQLPPPGASSRTGATLVLRPAEALHRPGQAAPPCAVLDGDRVGSGVCVTWLLWHITDTRFGETHSGRSACVCVAPFRGFLDGAPCSAAPCFVMVTVKSPLREDPGSMREPGPPAAPLEVRTERVFRPPAGLRGPEAESSPRAPRGCAAASEETGKQQAV